MFTPATFQIKPNRVTMAACLSSIDSFSTDIFDGDPDYEAD
jgi:hypothetical protein